MSNQRLLLTIILVVVTSTTAAIGYYNLRDESAEQAEKVSQTDDSDQVAITASTAATQRDSAPTVSKQSPAITPLPMGETQPESEYYGIKVGDDVDLSDEALKRFALTARSAIIQRIRANDSQMDEILTLTKDKVLRSTADDERIAELLSSQELITNFSQSLAKQPGKKELYRDDLQLRLLRLEFVQSALGKSPTLDKSAVLDELKIALLADTIEDDYALHQKKSLAYEKIQLMKTIAAHDPSYAEELKRNLDQSHNPKLYRYIVGQL